MSKGTPASAPLITLLTVVCLGAMAFAIPAARIEIDTPHARGYLVGFGRFSARLAEQIARSGYSELVIDVTDAQLGDDALWIEHFRAVSSLGIQVWAWIDVTDEAVREHAGKLIRSYNFAGVYVYGRGAAEYAAALARDSKDKEFVVVVRDGAAAPEGMRHAVAMGLDAFRARANEVELPVLIADQLDLADIADAREAASGDYVIANVAVLPFE